MAAPGRRSVPAPCRLLALSAVHPCLSTLIQSMYDDPGREPTDQPRGRRPAGGAPGDGLRLRQPRPPDQPSGGHTGGAAPSTATRWTPCWPGAARRGRPGRPPRPATWRGPVVDTDITLIEDGRLFFRGVDAVALARAGGLERAAQWLWTGETGPSRFVAPPEPLAAARAAVAALPAPADLVSRLRVAVAAASSADPLRYDTRGAAVLHHRAGCWPRWSGAPPPCRRRGHRRPRRGRRRTRLAARLWARLTARAPTRDCCGAWTPHSSCWWTTTSPSRRSPCAPPPPRARALRRGLHRAVGDGGAAARRRQHPGARRAAGCLDGDPRLVVAEHLRAGRPLPGFGHRLYPDGDPRARCCSTCSAVSPPRRPRRRRPAARRGQRPAAQHRPGARRPGPRRRDAARRGRGGLLGRPVGRVGGARPGGVRRAAAAVPGAGRLPRPPATATTSVDDLRRSGCPSAAHLHRPSGRPLLHRCPAPSDDAAQRCPERRRRPAGSGRTLEISPESVGSTGRRQRGSRMVEDDMGTKNKGGREVRKPKQGEKPKAQRRRRWCRRGASRGSTAAPGRPGAPGAHNSRRAAGVPAVVRCPPAGPAWGGAPGRGQGAAVVAPPPGAIAPPGALAQLGAGWLPGAVGCAGAVAEPRGPPVARSRAGRTARRSVHPAAGGRRTTGRGRAGGYRRGGRGLRREPTWWATPSRTAATVAVRPARGSGAGRGGGPGRDDPAERGAGGVAARDGVTHHGLGGGDAGQGHREHADDDGREAGEGVRPRPARGWCAIGRLCGWGPLTGTRARREADAPGCGRSSRRRLPAVRREWA